MSLEPQWEILSFVPVEVLNDPLPDVFRTDEPVVSAGALLKRFHALRNGYVESVPDDAQWMLPAREPKQVMVHGDYAPYNVAVRNGLAAGIIDLDTLHPAPAIRELACAVYRWAPMTDDGTPLMEQCRRTWLFPDAYGATREQREALPGMMAERLRALMDYMRTRAENGNEDFARNIAEGHLVV